MAEDMDWRQRRRLATIEEIKAAARQQIAKDGAAHLSLGAIARAMGMTPPALYRYFENRNALVVALIADAYNSMAEAMECAVEALPEGDHSGRFLALMFAYRQWALNNVQEYALMYADVELSGEQVQLFERATMRSLRAMVHVLRAAHDADCLVIPRQYSDPPTTVQRALAWMRQGLRDDTVPLGILALALTTWIRAHALVWQELHGSLPEALFGAGELYEMESRVLADRLGLAG